MKRDRKAFAWDIITYLTMILASLLSYLLLNIQLLSLIIYGLSSIYFGMGYMKYKTILICVDEVNNIINKDNFEGHYFYGEDK